MATSQDSDSSSTRKRVLAAIGADHALALYPDTDTPFLSETDKVHRLLPYHIFQHSKRDTDRIFARDGLGGDVPRDPEQVELDETRFAIECHRRLRGLRKRFREIRTRDAQRQYPGGESVVIAQAVLEADRAHNQELRTTRPPPLPPLPPGYAYRPYPPPPPPERFTTPIPVQLPLRLLPVLTGMGIFPVKMADLPPAGQPQPPCTELGISSDGTTLALTINLSLLQPVQMSSLAVLLNSLVQRPGHHPPPTAGASGSS